MLKPGRYKAEHGDIFHAYRYGLKVRVKRCGG